MSPTGLFRAWWEPIAVALLIVAVILTLGMLGMQPTFDAAVRKAAPGLTLSPNWTAETWRP